MVIVNRSALKISGHPVTIFAIVERLANCGYRSTPWKVCKSRDHWRKVGFRGRWMKDEGEEWLIGNTTITTTTTTITSSSASSGGGCCCGDGGGSNTGRA
ncbi:hypothetical protein M0802_005845 [Mischocyttarus mexicanus]|nr:hypothetical protein M0802_005845 [Mischocyttarus mexicanus]